MHILNPGDLSIRATKGAFVTCGFLCSCSIKSELKFNAFRLVFFILRATVFQYCFSRGWVSKWVSSNLIWPYIGIQMIRSCMCRDERADRTDHVIALMLITWSYDRWSRDCDERAIKFTESPLELVAHFLGGCASSVLRPHSLFWMSFHAYRLSLLWTSATSGLKGAHEMLSRFIRTRRYRSLYLFKKYFTANSDQVL